MMRVFSTSARDSRVLLALMMLGGLTLRLFGIDFGLPLRLHPDEPSQVLTAQQMLNGELNPHFFRYPSLFMDQLFVLNSALETISSLMGVSFSPSIYFSMGRWLSALYGTLTVWAVFLLGKNVIGEHVGLIGALLIATAPEHVRESHYATVDVAMVFWSVLALGLAMRAFKNIDLFFASAICAGLAIGTKYSAVLILVPTLSLLIWKITRENASDLGWQNSRWFAVALAGLGVIFLAGWSLLPPQAILGHLRQWTTNGEIQVEYVQLFNAALTGGWVVGSAITLFGMGVYASRHIKRIAFIIFHPRVGLFLLLVAGTFLITSPFIIFDLPNAARDILYEYRHALIGGSALYDPSDPLYGLLKSSEFFPQPTFYFDVWVNQNGWMMALAVLVGLTLLARQNLPASVLIGAIVVLMVFTLSRSASKAERYALLLVPLFSFCASVGIGMVMRARNMVRALIAVAALLIVLFTPIRSTATILYREFFLPDTRVLAFRWLEQHAMPDSIIVRETNTPDVEDASVKFRVITANSAFERKSFDEWQRDGLRFVLVGTIREWYRVHADIYPTVALNYDLLETRAQLMQAFIANASSAGPPVWIYQMP